MFGQPPAATTGATTAIAGRERRRRRPTTRADPSCPRAPVVQIASATAGAMNSPCALVRIAAAISAPAERGPAAGRRRERGHCRQHVLRVEIAEDAGVEQRRRIQPVTPQRPAAPQPRSMRARDQAEQQQRRGRFRPTRPGSLTNAFSGVALGKLAMRPDPVAPVRRRRARTARAADSRPSRGRAGIRRARAARGGVPPTPYISPTPCRAAL